MIGFSHVCEMELCPNCKGISCSCQQQLTWLNNTYFWLCPHCGHAMHTQTITTTNAISLRELIKRDIGSIGTLERDEFEKEVEAELSGLSNYELELEKVVEEIRFSKTTIEGIVVLKKYIQKKKLIEIIKEDEKDELYE